MEFTHDSTSLNTWWVHEPVFLAGASPVSYDVTAQRQFLRHLLESGIRTFISLQEEDEVARKPKPFYHSVLELLREERQINTTSVRVPVMDGSTMDDDTIHTVLDIIDSSIRRKRPVYLHCLAGAGRTGTIAGCWLVRHGLSGDKALARLNQLRSHDPALHGKPCPQKPGQVEKVRHWKE